MPPSREHSGRLHDVGAELVCSDDEHGIPSCANDPEIKNMSPPGEPVRQLHSIADCSIEENKGWDVYLEDAGAA